MTYADNTLFKKSKISDDKNLYILEYIGDWENNQMQGRGKIIFSNSKYVGEMKSNFMHYFGIMRYNNGDKYYGTWDMGEYQDFGTKIYNNNSKYIGLWRKGLFFGHGKFFYVNGDVYIGAWENGYRFGYGELTYNNGKTISGKFSNGIFGNGIYRLTDLFQFYDLLKYWIYRISN